jgi:hypothetical protein
VNDELGLEPAGDYFRVLSEYLLHENRIRLVSKMTDYGLQDRGSIAGKVRGVQIGFMACPTPYPIDISGPFPGDKAVGA